VLKALEKSKLNLNMKKCGFAQKVLLYLGFMVGGDQLKIDPAKV